jgi:hypothetical protein
MTKDLIVCTNVSKRGEKLMPILERQLKEAGIEFCIDEYPDADWKSLSSIRHSVERFRDLAERFKDYERIIHIDGHDVLFYGTKEDLINRVKTGCLMFAAETNCFPDYYYPDTEKRVSDMIKAGTKWKYVNGGGYAGSPQDYLNFADAIENDESYNPEGINQGVYNLLVAKGEQTLDRDTESALFYCAFNCESDLGIENGMPINKVTGRRPCFVHFNGGADYRPFLRAIGEKLPQQKIDYIFCQPGNPSSGPQALALEAARTNLARTGKSIGIMPAYCSDVYAVRNGCLGGDGEKVTQKPFQGEWDYDRIIWVDSDNIVTTDQIKKLIARDVDVIAAWYRVYAMGDVNNDNLACCGKWECEPRIPGVSPGVNKSTAYTVGGMLEFAKKGDLIEVNYVGMGLMIIKKGVLESLEYPWFIGWPIEYEKDGELYRGMVREDAGLCRRLQEKGYKIYVDPCVNIKHLKPVQL